MYCVPVDPTVMLDLLCLLDPTSEFSLRSSKLVFHTSVDETTCKGGKNGENKNNRMEKLNQGE